MMSWYEDKPTMALCFLFINQTPSEVKEFMDSQIMKKC